MTHTCIKSLHLNKKNIHFVEGEIYEFYFGEPAKYKVLVVSAKGDKFVMTDNEYNKYIGLRQHCKHGLPGQFNMPY